MIRYSYVLKSVKAHVSKGIQYLCLPILFVLLLFPVFLSAQNFDQYVFSVQGDYEQTENMSLSWTLGDQFIETVMLDPNIYTQGFQQSFFKFREIINVDVPAYDATIYPNPSYGIVKLRVKNENNPFILELFDVAGKLVYKSERIESLSELNLRTYMQGKYFVRISDPKSPRSSLFEIIKL